jgi:hypothetical protein
VALVEGDELAGVPETETEERELDGGAVDEGEGVVAGGVLTTALVLVVLDTETETEVETGLEVWLPEAEVEAEPETVPDGEVERQLVEPVCDQRGEGEEDKRARTALSLNDGGGVLRGAGAVLDGKEEAGAGGCGRNPGDGGVGQVRPLDDWGVGVGGVNDAGSGSATLERGQTRR